MPPQRELSQDLRIFPGKVIEIRTIEQKVQAWPGGRQGFNRGCSTNGVYGCEEGHLRFSRQQCQARGREPLLMKKNNEKALTGGQVFINF
jgi:hypothetical protein